MYAPILLLILVTGVISSGSAIQASRVFIFGLTVIFSYFLSVMYGLKWSFPYSNAIYISVFGKDIGNYFVAHWGGFLLFSLTLFSITMFAAWRNRSIISLAWARYRLKQYCTALILFLISCSLLYGVYKGYQLGFTPKYAVTVIFRVMACLMQVAEDFSMPVH